MTAAALAGGAAGASRLPAPLPQHCLPDLVPPTTTSAFYRWIYRMTPSACLLLRATAALPVIHLPALIPRPLPVIVLYPQFLPTHPRTAPVACLHTFCVRLVPWLDTTTATCIAATCRALPCCYVCLIRTDASWLHGCFGSATYHLPCGVAPSFTAHYMPYTCHHHISVPAVWLVLYRPPRLLLRVLRT